jgi:hypothetical protein
MRILAQRPFQIAFHEAPLGPVHGGTAHRHRARNLFVVNPVSPEASKSWFLRKICPSSTGSKSTSHNHCAEVLVAPPRRPSCGRSRVHDASRIAYGGPWCVFSLEGYAPLAICCISATDWFSVSPSDGLRRHRGLLCHARHAGATMPAFGESCRRRGHALVSLIDPEQTPIVHRSSSVDL